MYTPKPETLARLDNNFTYHKPIGSQQERYVAIRDAAKQFALVLATNAPESRELSVAMTELETSVFWANAAIARNEKEPTE
jgi:hypothetical protein